MPVLPQNSHNALFLYGRKFCKDHRLFCRLPQLHVVHLFQLCARQDPARKANLFTDARSHLFVVARQDFDGDAALFQLGDRICRRGFGRVEKGEIPHQHHVRFPFAYRPVYALLCHTEHSHSLCIQLFRTALYPVAQRIVQSANFSFRLRKRTDGKHFFHGALCDQLRFSALVLNNDAHPAPFKIEGKFVRFAKTGQNVRIHLPSFDQFARSLDDGDIQ